MIESISVDLPAGRRGMASHKTKIYAMKKAKKGVSEALKLRHCGSLIMIIAIRCPPPSHKDVNT
jgi:hypothetical protein